MCGRTAFMGVFREKLDLEPVLNRIRELEIACDELKRANRALNLEFTELYDKVSHQMSRMAKRFTAAKRDDPTPEEQEGTNFPGDSVDPISRSILLRRGRMTEVK